MADLEEKWTKKYKKSINCNAPKGFSQRAHCAARRKRQAGGQTSSKSVSEAFKQPYKMPSKWAGDPAVKQITLPDGQILRIEIRWDQENRYALVNFFVNDQQQITHKGDPFKIFSTVIHAIDDFVRKKKPYFIAWTASDSEPSRIKFYDRLVPWMQTNKILADYENLTDADQDLIPDDFIAFIDEYQDPVGKTYVLGRKSWLRQHTLFEFQHSQIAVAEDLRKWFKQKWVRFGPDGKIRGACARGSEGEGKPKCLPQKKAWSLAKKRRATAAARKRRQDPNPEREGKAKNVATKESVGSTKLGDLCTIKTNFPDADFWLVRRGDRKNVGKPTKEFSPYHVGIKVTATEQLMPQYLYYMMMHLHNQGYWQTRSMGTTALLNIRTEDVKNIQLALTEHELKENSSCPHCGGHMVSHNLLNEKKDACYYKVKSRYKVWPSAYASGALVQCRKKGAKNWGNKGKKR